MNGRIAKALHRFAKGVAVEVKPGEQVRADQIGGVAVRRVARGLRRSYVRKAQTFRATLRTMMRNEGVLK